MPSIVRAGDLKALPLIEFLTRFAAPAGKEAEEAEMSEAAEEAPVPQAGIHIFFLIIF